MLRVTGSLRDHQIAGVQPSGASPVEASSGKTQRHRLNRGGDRHRMHYGAAMTSVEQLRARMLEELRAEIVASDHGERWATRLRLRLKGAARALPSPGRLLLGVIATSCLIAAAIIFICHWPPGGGRYTSSFVFTQGASLVFVVILLSLLAGPISAGKQIGWDSGWVIRDPRPWLGLGMVALLSLGELWLGWLRPERAEAGATVLVTAAGLAITVLTAWRLVYLSDPVNQLDARLKSQLPKLERIIRRANARHAKAARRRGVSPEVANEMVQYAPSAAKSGMIGCWISSGLWSIDKCTRATGLLRLRVMAE
jgi:hypothetical protein